jgi:probable rRNA maturation factor
MSHSTPSDTIFSNGLAISLANEQSAHPIDAERLKDAARRVLEDAGLTSAAISLAVVDDRAIHELNLRYLNHDWPTDVLSFVLDESDGHLEGEVVISADAAAVAAAEVGWSAAEEQLLYVIHGTLHLVGLDDQTTDDAARMRSAERRCLAKFGVEQPAAKKDKDGTANPISAGRRPRGEAAS